MLQLPTDSFCFLLQIYIYAAASLLGEPFLPAFPAIAISMGISGPSALSKLQWPPRRDS
jgi:hypothetical protein